MTLAAAHRFVATLALVGIASLSSACGSTDASSTGSAGSGGTSSNGGASASAGAGGEAGTTTCPDFLGEPLAPNFGNCDSGACFSCVTPIQGMSFAKGMFSNTDASGVTQETLSKPEPGTVCMSGTSLGYAQLTLALAPGPPFDAAMRGITQIQFTVQTPPSVGVLPQLDAWLPDMTPTGFNWARGVVSTAITQLASLSDFQNPDGFPLDTNQLLGVAFSVSAAEHYDFCVRDLKFLDASGVEVLPPAP